MYAGGRSYALEMIRRLSIFPPTADGDSFGNVGDYSARYETKMPGVKK